MELLQQRSGVKYLTRRQIPSAEAEGFGSLIDRIGVRISYAPKERIFPENTLRIAFIKSLAVWFAPANSCATGVDRSAGSTYRAIILDLSGLTHILSQRKQSQTLKFAKLRKAFWRRSPAAMLNAISYCLRPVNLRVCRTGFCF